MPKLMDLTGKIYGRLTVVSFSRKGNKYNWNCICSCGSTTTVQSGNLKNGHTKSCGCLNREVLITHGESIDNKTTKEYRAFRHILERCYKATHESYANYGGRGIKVCDRWRNSFENFLTDMGRAPSSKHSIDRKENDGNYEPGNCRWATKKEQQNNTRSCKMLSYKGKTQTLSNWCSELNLRYSTIRSRIYEYGWTLDEALQIKITKQQRVKNRNVTNL